MTVKLTPASITQAAIAELTRRLASEREKARVKYGELALVPTGHPERDVHDYCINELVGLVRYGEMIRKRHEMLDGDFVQQQLSGRGISFGDTLQDTAEQLALQLIQLRLDMKKAGLLLGQPENRG